MTAHTCRTIRRQLAAFHDGELAVGDQIAVQTHLRHCASCAAEARELTLLSSMVRAGSPAIGGTPELLAGLPAGVVSRLKAEREQSLTGWSERLFDDLHVFWAAVGATGATVACLAIIFGIFYYAAHERPDSIGGLLAAASLPAGSNENPLEMDGRMLLPRATDGDAFPEAALLNEDESVFAFAASLTREGTIAYLELLHAEAVRGNVRSRQEEQAVVNLLAKARFEPARYGGAPVAVNMVWLYTQLTVRGKVPDDSRPPVRSISSVRVADTLAT